MGRNHGARQQKRVAKQKAKRAEKRAGLERAQSSDPTVRLQRADQWPVVETWAGTGLWKQGIGYLSIARQEAEGSWVFAVFLVDVQCLGVKDAFWKAGTPREFREMLHKLEETQAMERISPASLAKIVQGAVEFAQSFGFKPQADYHHAKRLLEGIDPAACTQEFTFGRDGKPFYVSGPFETVEQARVIAERVKEAGGHYIVSISGPAEKELVEDFDLEDIELEDFEEDFEERGEDR